MMTIRILLNTIVLLFTLFAPLSAQLAGGGSITAYVDSIITSIPDATPSNLYQVPNSAQASLWSSIVEDMLNGALVSAQGDATSIDYDIVSFTDTTNSKTYPILRKRTSGANYWGTVIIDPSPLRSRLFIQAPHPLHDANTGNQAIVVFKNTGARAFILAGTHRCNSSSLSSCDGTTSVCGGSNQFRKSDQAHNNDGPFQIATERFKHSVPNAIVIQLHGFVKDPGYPDLILGNGTQSVPATDWLTRFKDELTVLDGTLQYKLAHVDTVWTTLTGTTNTQGRLINNSQDPCGTAAEIPNGRFLHIEQAFSGLRDNPVNYAKVASAISNTFPPDKVIASAANGNWENTSTWIGSIVPNDTTHVVIASGHTVTVTSATAEAKSLSFGDQSAHIALASGADLSLTGDLTLATETHAAFSSWAAGATVSFNGADDQSLNGWNRDSTNFSTSLMEMIVDKSAGTLTTSGTDMNLNIGTRMEILDGTFELTAGDDFEGRDLAGNAAVPAITIHSGGVFIVRGDTSYLRSGTSDILATGLLRNYGTAKFYGTDLSIGYNFADLYIEDGGTVEVFTGWKSSQLLRVDTLLLKAGSVFTTSTTANVIPSSGITVLNAGGMYRILGSSVNFSSNFTNNGTIEYASSGTQTVSDRTYKKVLFSNGGVKNWSLTTNRSPDTVEVNGAASLNLSSASAYTFTVAQRLSMFGGNISTGNNTLVLGTETSQRGTLMHSSGAVIGPFKRYLAAATVDDILFPVGNNSYLRTVSLDVTSAPLAGSITARFTASNPGTTGLPLNDAGFSVINLSPEGYWSITAGDGLSGGAYLLDISAAGFSGIVSVATLRLLNRANGGSWSVPGTHMAGTGTISSPVVTRTGLISLGEFGIGGGVENPLPVELVSFTATALPKAIKLHWITATEVNNHGFEVERSAVSDRHLRGDGHFEWAKVGFIEGSGTSNEPHEYSFADRIISAGSYVYRLKQFDRDGKFVYSKEEEVTVASAPAKFELAQNYPNPFNPSTTIGFTLQASGMTTLKVYDAIGREAVTLVNENLEAGVYHERMFDASKLSRQNAGRRLNSSSGLASGIYFARLFSGGNVQVRKLMLVK